MDTGYFTKMLHLKKIVKTKRLNNSNNKKKKQRKKNKIKQANKTSKETEILGK